MRIKVVHIINSFEYGGAEVMLDSLLSRMDRGRFEPVVVSLIDDLRLAGGIVDSGIPLTVMGMRPGVLDPLALGRLAWFLGRERPAIVQTWMDHSNLLGGIAARMAGCPHIVWGVHHSEHVPGLAKRTTLWTVSACARVSGWLPSRIVCCSEHARDEYERQGFAVGRLAVIPNGFDTDRFRPDPSARAGLRRELGLSPETPLVGLVARYDPVKDHHNFLRAAARLRGMVPEAHFLLCGDRVAWSNPELSTAIDALGLRDRCHLLGPRRDISRIQAGLDVATSASISEAFPLTLGEAMACGVPCVATDVGDSARIIGEAGRIVPPRASKALAEACAELLGLSPRDRERLSRAARGRIIGHFDLSTVARRYEDLYERLILGERTEPGPTAGRLDPVSDRRPVLHR